MRTRLPTRRLGIVPERASSEIVDLESPITRAASATVSVIGAIVTVNRAAGA